MKIRALIVVVVMMLAACGGGEEGATETTEEMMGETSTSEEMMGEDVLAVAEAEGDLGTFLAAVDSAGMMEDLHGEGPFTVFAPTDDAFEAYLESSGMTQEEALAGGEMLQAVVGSHLVAMREDSAMVMGHGRTVPDRAQRSSTRDHGGWRDCDGWGGHRPPL